MKKLIVEDVGEHHIRFLCVLRRITRLGLRDAKTIQDSLPGVLLDGLSDNQVQIIADQFRSIGARIEIRSTATETVMIRFTGRLKT